MHGQVQRIGIECEPLRRHPAEPVAGRAVVCIEPLALGNRILVRVDWVRGHGPGGHLFVHAEEQQGADPEAECRHRCRRISRVSPEGRQRPPPDREPEPGHQEDESAKFVPGQARCRVLPTAPELAGDNRRPRRANIEERLHVLPGWPPDLYLDPPAPLQCEVRPLPGEHVVLRLRERQCGGADVRILLVAERQAHAFWDHRLAVPRRYLHEIAVQTHLVRVYRDRDTQVSGGLDGVICPRLL